MGMFDTIRVNVPLPECPVWVEDGHWFQTKSLECTLDKYLLTAEGKLWRKKHDFEGKNEDRAPEFMESFTGEVVFYDGYWPDMGPDRKRTPKNWAEYSAYFVSGVMKQLHRVGMK